MKTTDQKAILASYHVINLVNWINKNQDQPVPTHLLQDALESFADYCGNRFIERLSETCEQPQPILEPIDAPPDETGNQPDPEG